MDSSAVKLALASFLMMTSTSMGIVTCEQWFSKISLLFVAHTIVKHLFAAIGPKVTFNWKEFREDFAWKCVGGMMAVTWAETFVGTPQDIAVTNMLTELCLILCALSMVRYTKLHKTHSQDLRLLERGSLASVSARTTFSFLENIIKGKKDTMTSQGKKNGNEECFFGQILKNYLYKERIVASHYPKLLLLFPECKTGPGGGEAFGSVEDILHKEKEEGAEHTLTKDKIKYEYQASSGMKRTSQLEVLKWQIKHDVIYLVISENRILKTFYQMLSEPSVDFRFILCHSFF